MSQDVNERNKKPSGRDWLSVLLPIGTLILGAFLTPTVNAIFQHYYDEQKVIPMLNQFLEEIYFNKNSLEQIPQPTASFLGTVNSGKKDTLIGNFTIQEDLYNSYLNQMNLLDENIQADITLYYEQLQGVQETNQSLQQVTDAYNSNQPYAKPPSVINMGNNLISSALTAIDESSILQAELIVNDGADTPSYINEDYVAKIKPAVVNYLDNTASTTISFAAVKQATGDNDGFATALLLLRLGLNVDHPLSNLEFQR